jgi:hypothetical protein
MLVEYKEHGWHPGCSHVHCLEVHDDYYHPVIILNTKAQLVEWLKEKYPAGNLTVEGDSVVYVERFNWKDESKGIDTYYMVEVTLGKVIVY